MVISAAIEEEYHYKNCCADENGEFLTEMRFLCILLARAKYDLIFRVSMCGV